MIRLASAIDANQIRGQVPVVSKVAIRACLSHVVVLWVMTPCRRYHDTEDEDTHLPDHTPQSTVQIFTAAKPHDVRIFFLLQLCQYG
jgi:hypothetical protein